jgi:hypothetical protein
VKRGSLKVVAAHVSIAGIATHAFDAAFGKRLARVVVFACVFTAQWRALVRTATVCDCVCVCDGGFNAREKKATNDLSSSDWRGDYVGQRIAAMPWLQRGDIGTILILGME